MPVWFVKAFACVLPWVEMIAALIFVVLASGLLACLTGVAALRAGLKLRRTHFALRSHLISELARLAGRTAELEERLTALDARAQALPVRISELQQNLATLRLLTNALGTSLRQVLKLLSPGSIKSSLTNPLANAFRNRSARRGNS